MAHTIGPTWRLPTKRRLLFLKDCTPESPVPRRERERRQPLRRPYEQERRTLMWPPTSSPRWQARACSGVPTPRDGQRHGRQALKEGVEPRPARPAPRATYFMPEIFKLFLSKRPIDCGKTRSQRRQTKHCLSSTHSSLQRQPAEGAVSAQGDGPTGTHPPRAVPTAPIPAPRGSSRPEPGPENPKGRPRKTTLSPLGHPHTKESSAPATAPDRAAQVR